MTDFAKTLKGSFLIEQDYDQQEWAHLYDLAAKDFNNRGVSEAVMDGSTSVKLKDALDVYDQFSVPYILVGDIALNKAGPRGKIPEVITHERFVLIFGD